MLAQIFLPSVSGSNRMYDLDSFERALAHFGTRVDIICALEMGGKIDAQSAYKEIKEELKNLKKAKKQYAKEQ